MDELLRKTIETLDKQKMDELLKRTIETLDKYKEEEVSLHDAIEVLNKIHLEKIKEFEKREKEGTDLIEAIGKSVIAAIKEVKIEQPKITVNVPEIKVPEIKSPKIPDIHVPEPKVTVNIPKMKFPRLEIPKIEIPKMEAQKIDFPKYPDFPTTMKVLLSEISRKNPLPVLQVDLNGKPYFGSLGIYGGGGGARSAGGGLLSTKTPLSASAPTSFSVGVASGQAVASNTSRTGLVLTNTSANTISIGIGAVAVLNSGITLYPRGVWVMDEFNFTFSAINAIASVAASNLAIQEFS